MTIKRIEQLIERYHKGILFSSEVVAEAARVIPDMNDSDFEDAKRLLEAVSEKDITFWEGICNYGKSAPWDREGYNYYLILQSWCGGEREYAEKRKVISHNRADIEDRYQIKKKLRQRLGIPRPTDKEIAEWHKDHKKRRVERIYKRLFKENEFDIDMATAYLYSEKYTHIRHLSNQEVFDLLDEIAAVSDNKQREFLEEVRHSLKIRFIMESCE